jgi:ATP-binding cassette subfamily B protein RaxB
MLFAFLAYKDQFSRRIAGLIDNFFELKMLRLHGERVADIVLSEVEQESMGDTEVDTSKVAPVIEIRNLSYRYSPSEPWILRNIDLRIEAGECIAIAGPSGCGKTTLIKLMLGLLTPTEGSVHIGDLGIHQLGLSNYRNMIGTVMQDDTLFSGSIADNICFFDPTMDHAQVEAAARQAAVHEEIAQMPMGYNSLVGDIGSGMSGGQKQRVLLARALYKRPSILVLDEATSHLDVGNERMVNSVVKAMQLTRIVVAHRPETIAMAQRVVMLENGRIVRDLVMSEKNHDAETAS